MSRRCSIHTDHPASSSTPRSTCWALAIALTFPAAAGAGGFITAEEGFEAEITHPNGYTGTGGELSITVCIDPGATNASAMEIPVRNAILEFNRLTAVTGNLALGADNELDPSEVDFESVAVHELGHCMGLAHPNLGSTAGANDDFTQSTEGVDGVFDFDNGADALDGSADDLRDDDDNLHWFRLADNNPFGLEPSIIDATTYSIDLGDLPSGDLFAANADRNVGAALGFNDTEAVMQQGQFFDEAQRQLTPDDVATLRLGMAGLDETQATADDYTFELSYAGLTTGCDIVFESNASGFASCSIGFTTLASNHTVITSGTIRYNSTDFSWFFTDALNETGSLIVEKLTRPAGGGVVFNFAGDVSGDLTDGESLTVTGLEPGAYTSVEGESLFYDLTSISCDDSDSSGDLGSRSANFVLAGGEVVTCTFTGTEVPCKASDITLDLSGNVVTGNESFEACETIIAGPFTVESGGQANLLAGERIILRDGFGVEAGGELTTRIERP